MFIVQKKNIFIYLLKIAMKIKVSFGMNVFGLFIPTKITNRFRLINQSQHSLHLKLLRHILPFVYINIWLFSWLIVA